MDYDEENSHFVSPGSCVGQAVFELVPASQALAVFPVLFSHSNQTVVLAVFTKVKSRQGKREFCFPLLVGRTLSVQFFMSPLAYPFPSQRGGNQAKEVQVEQKGWGRGTLINNNKITFFSGRMFV